MTSNWYKNVIKASRPLKDMGLLNDKEEIDFERLIPMPKSLRVPAGGDQGKAIIYYVSNKLTIPVEILLQSPLLSEDVNTSFGCGGDIKEIYDNLKENGIDDSYDGIDNEPTSLYKTGETYVFNILEYGAPNWYPWAMQHWGTKWNAMESKLSEDGTVVTFDTPNGIPVKYYAKLTVKYPNEKFEISYEDSNGYGQAFTLQNGKLNDVVNVSEKKEL